MNVPIEKWKWYGMPGHLIVGDRCVHHLCTEVGQYLISTVGEYRPDHKKDREEVGCGRFFETYVFKLGRKFKRCSCGCGVPTPSDMCEIDSLPANDAINADKNHMKMCRKYSQCL